ncbi:TadE/TadG family type IV pilus assembly protein [Marinobacterium sediminicola]|uniref:Flp pilus assembly protein TadG n=1 Tax=Marinobacterium sediminicola TaxID=518898 RepID=A0ABY1S066_9GAMM|nr:TadE/TadG family type IV pilus assembly protein [Marinobacterium sediminicola]ULG69964.1 pilus assembly protein [Marinobacterium sediminicola]SMR74414.1 Flp pilus assembly protein TadG [Marinobacterium sediminicola]
MTRRPLLSGKRQQGLAAVEMTLVLPVLLLLLLATAEIGRMLYQYNTLTKAQRSGARLLATHLNYGQQAVLNDCPTLDDPVILLPDNLMARSRNLIVYGSELGGDEPVLPGLETADVSFCEVPALNEVQVHVRYDFSPMLFNSLPTFGLGDPVNIDFTLDSSISMRVLGGS